MGNEQPSKFTWIYAARAVILVLISIFAVTVAVQEHNDRVLTDEIAGLHGNCRMSAAGSQVSEMPT